MLQLCLLLLDSYNLLRRCCSIITFQGTRLQVGQHPKSMQHVAVVCADGAAPEQKLVQYLRTAVHELQAAGALHVTVHDAFERLQPSDIPGAPGAHSNGNSLPGHERQVQYTCPAAAARAWQRAMRVRSQGQPSHGAASKELQGQSSEVHNNVLQLALQACHEQERAVDSFDLVLVVGPVLCLAGLAPWQTRFCEIHHLGPADRDCHAAVQRALERYHSTLQRFGK